MMMNHFLPPGDFQKFKNVFSRLHWMKHQSFVFYWETDLFSKLRTLVVYYPRHIVPHL